MNTEKPITEWLAELPDGYRERALSQHDDVFKYANNLNDAVFHFTAWPETKEGHEFWCKVWNHYEFGDDLPPLPSTVNDTLAKIRELEQRGESGNWQFPSEELIELANEIESLREKNADIKKDISNEIKRLEEIYAKY
jgi:hypothetical protein